MSLSIDDVNSNQNLNRTDGLGTRLEYYSNNTFVAKVLTFYSDKQRDFEKTESYRAELEIEKL